MIECWGPGVFTLTHHCNSTHTSQSQSGANQPASLSVAESFPDSITLGNTHTSTHTPLTPEIHTHKTTYTHTHTHTHTQGNQQQSLNGSTSAITCTEGFGCGSRAGACSVTRYGPHVPHPGYTGTRGACGETERRDGIKNKDINLFFFPLSPGRVRLRFSSLPLRPSLSVPRCTWLLTPWQDPS